MLEKVSRCSEVLAGRAAADSIVSEEEARLSTKSANVRRRSGIDVFVLNCTPRSSLPAAPLEDAW